MASPFAQAIATAEGYGVAGARPTVNNNPGDLVGWPGVPQDGEGYSVFPTPQAGWAALETQLSTISNGESAYYSPDMTIAQMGSTWADGDPNWAANVSASLGVSSSAQVGSFIGGTSTGAPGVDVEPAGSWLDNLSVTDWLLLAAFGAAAVYALSELA
jgi:hypothetical protein